MAANVEKGEVSLLVEGKRYILTVTLAAAAEVEDVSATRQNPSGRTWPEIIRGVMQRQSIRDLLLMMWVALRTHHPDLANDDPDVLKRMSDFVTRAGGLEALNAQLEKLVRLHTQPTELATTGGDDRPPDA